MSLLFKLSLMNNKIYKILSSIMKKVIYSKIANFLFIIKELKSISD